MYKYVHNLTSSYVLYPVLYSMYTVRGIRFDTVTVYNPIIRTGYGGKVGSIGTPYGSNTKSSPSGRIGLSMLSRCHICDGVHPSIRVEEARLHILRTIGMKEKSL